MMPTTFIYILRLKKNDDASIPTYLDFSEYSNKPALPLHELFRLNAQTALLNITAIFITNKTTTQKLNNLPEDTRVRIKPDFRSLKSPLPLLFLKTGHNYDFKKRMA